MDGVLRLTTWLALRLLCFWHLFHVEMLDGEVPMRLSRGDRLVFHMCALSHASAARLKQYFLIFANLGCFPNLP